MKPSFNYLTQLWFVFVTKIHQLQLEESPVHCRGELSRKTEKIPKKIASVLSSFPHGCTYTTVLPQVFCIKQIVPFFLRIERSPTWSPVSIVIVQLSVPRSEQPSRTLLAYKDKAAFKKKSEPGCVWQLDKCRWPDGSPLYVCNFFVIGFCKGRWSLFPGC